MRLTVIVAGLIAGLYGVDKFLASQEQMEIRQDAERVFRQGEKQLKTGKPREAAASFARAHALERGNRRYQLELANAQLTAGEVGTAAATLEDVLQDDSNDGPANLLMARAAMAAGHPADADSFYHRAIYGTWKSNDDRDRARVRLELAELLARRGAKGELLSELLLLQNEPANPARQKKVAELFLQAGSPVRAADAYHALIKANPDDADGFAGLGKAEIASGDYALAVSAYRGALRRRPNDEKLLAELAMSEKLAELDPTSRRMSAEERKRRSLAVLDAVAECVGVPPEQLDDDDEVIENAERLWKSHGEKCTGNPEPFEVLPVLMRKLGSN